MTEYSYNVNKNCIEKNGKFVAYVNVVDTKRIVDLLNKQKERIMELEWSNKILRANRKDCEKGRIFERKQWEKMDKMRIEHIKFLQKRLKKNGLSIYINGAD